MTRTYTQYEADTFGEPKLADGTAIYQFCPVFRVVGINEDEYGVSTEFEIRTDTLTGKIRHNDGWYAETTEYGFAEVSTLFATRLMARHWILDFYRKEKREIDAKIRRLK